MSILVINTKTIIVIRLLYSPDFILTAPSTSIWAQATPLPVVLPLPGLINRPPSMRGKPYVTRYHRIGAANLFIYLFTICAAQQPPSIMKSYRKAAQDYLPTTSLKWKRIQSNERNQTNNEASPVSFPSLPFLSLKALVAVVGGGDGGRSALEGRVQVIRVYKRIKNLDFDLRYFGLWRQTGSLFSLNWKQCAGVEQMGGGCGSDRGLSGGSADLYLLRQSPSSQVEGRKSSGA